jgi:hypothetical protein
VLAKQLLHTQQQTVFLTSPRLCRLTQVPGIAVQSVAPRLLSVMPAHAIQPGTLAAATAAAQQAVWVWQVKQGRCVGSWRQ